MKGFFALIVLFFFSSALFSQTDPLNTYRWNRQNVLAGNGMVDKAPWFEWWYYKVVIPKFNQAFFMVYGAVNPWDFDYKKKGTRANVAFGDFGKKIQAEENFPLQDFYAKYDQTYVELNNQNIATDKYLKGSIKNHQGETFKWDIEIEKAWSFNATSWLTGRGVTNIEWYPAQASASCTGKVESQNKVYQFQNAPCYQDRNWGQSFPDWWAWIVSNSFEKSPGTALAIGGGRPKIFSRLEVVENVAIGFFYKGKEYTWRLNEFDYIKIDISFGKWLVSARNRTHSLEVEAFAPLDKFMDLQFMTPEGEIFHDYEALMGDLQVKFYKNQGLKKVLIETLNSKHAGIEYGSEKIYPLESLFTGNKNLL